MFASPNFFRNLENFPKIYEIELYLIQKPFTKAHLKFDRSENGSNDNKILMNAFNHITITYHYEIEKIFIPVFLRFCISWERRVALRNHT